jgi:hypothetical protein
MDEYHRALEEYEHALQHITEESLEIPRIYANMELCRRKIVEIDVRQTMTFLLDEVVKLPEEDRNTSKRKMSNCQSVENKIGKRRK